MLGETGVGTWIAYGVIVAFLVLITVVVLRTIVMLSLLLLSPSSRLARWLMGDRAALTGRDQERPRE
jgi:hypothetical protein